MPARKQVKKKRQGPGSPWLWFFSGLLSGLLLMTLGLQSGIITLPRSLRHEPPAQATEAPEEAAISDTATATDSSEYDFFRILPEQDIVVPESEIRRRADQQSDDSGERFVLQVASLKSARDADALKARLLLLGMEAHILAVTVDGETWHRVRVGPLASAREADSYRRQLRANGFEAMIIRQQADQSSKPSAN